MQKTYIARVLGVFPSTPEPLVISVPLAWDQRTNHVIACPESEAPAAQTAGEVPEQGLPDPGPGPAAAAERASPPGGGESVHPSAAEPTDASTDAAKRRHAFREQRRLKAVAKQRRLAEQRVAAEVARATGVAQAKLAVTEFRLLAVAPDHLTSLVECRSVLGLSGRHRAGPPPPTDTQDLPQPAMIDRPRASTRPRQPPAPNSKPLLASSGHGRGAHTRFGCTCNTRAIPSPTTGSTAAATRDPWPCGRSRSGWAWAGIRCGASPGCLPMTWGCRRRDCQSVLGVQGTKPPPPNAQSSTSV